MQQGAANAGGELDIAERRDVHVGLGISQDFSRRPSPFRPEHVFEQRGRVGDDEPQEASRAPRSSPINSDALRRSLTAGLASILVKTSSDGGLATSRSNRSWM
jgi:hypothetical protein